MICWRAVRQVTARGIASRIFRSSDTPPSLVPTLDFIHESRLPNRTLHARPGGPVSRPLVLSSPVSLGDPIHRRQFLCLKGLRYPSFRNGFNWQRLETARIATLSQQLSNVGNVKWDGQIFRLAATPPTMLASGGRGMARDLTA